MGIIHNEKEVRSATLNYFNDDALASDVFIKKYALQNQNLEYEDLTPDDTHIRMASEFARIERNYLNPLSKEEIYSYFKNFKYIIPQGSPMEGIGNNYRIQSLSNCFVIESPSDSYGGILKTDQEQAQIMKRRGGVGFDISYIRPKGVKTKNAAKTSDGIGIFMERFSNTTREVAQNGRRGALMLSIASSHYEIETFIDIKKNLTKVTGANISIRIDDKLMQAVKNNEMYTLQWPVNVENPTVKKEISARKLWEKITDAAWEFAEPGVLFWDTIVRNTPSDIYKDFGFNSISVNPCISGDTLIAVADGRMNVRIDQLAKEEKDVNVYCLNDKGDVCIETMRNPRITGFNQPIYKITLENGHEIKVTKNHKFLLTTGEYKEAIDIAKGDSLHIMTKYEASFDEIFNNSNSKRQNYFWINNKGKNKAEHRIIADHESKINYGEVVHHKDFNGLNNSIDNLKILSKADHDYLHSESIKGLNNPYFKYDHVKRAFDNAASHPGEKNGRYIAISDEDLKKYASELMIKMQRLISWHELYEYLKDTYNIVIPENFTLYRKKTLSNFLELIAVDLNINNDLIFNDPRIIKRYKRALEQYNNVKIENGLILVEKICEGCGNKYWTNYDKREISFCSISCSNVWHNRNTNVNINRTININKTYKAKADITKQNQIKVFNDLKFNNNNIPNYKDWVTSCKTNKIVYRLGTKYGFKSYDDMQEASSLFNHRVVSVEFCGNENVYNGTVYKYHNFFVGEFKEFTKSNKRKFVYLNNMQCGEICLSSYDSCRLMVINATSYVNNHFKPEAIFDYELFAKHVIVAQRLMDDLVDLELEQIDKILNKIERDPENDETKRIEKNLWLKIKTAAQTGRRTGLGITGLGDAIAMLNIKYGSDESIIEIEKIYKTLAINSERSSVILAKERGAFPIWSFELEKGHPFLEKIWAEDAQLYEDYKASGRRSIATTTTAPVGSMSMMTQTSSGIEPVFMTDYKRRKKIMGDSNIIPDFIDASGDKWQEFIVYHHGLKEWMDVTGETDISKSPYYKATANEIDAMQTVKIQSVAQKWLEHSISKTCVTSDTLIETENGLEYVFELDTAELINTHVGNLQPIEDIWSNGKRDVYEVKTINGKILKCTKEHKILTIDHETGNEIWKEVQYLKSGDMIKT